MQKARFKDTEIGKIPEEWEVKGLLALTSKITKGTTPTTAGGRFVKEGVNFIKVEALTDDGSISKEKFMYIDESTHELLARSKLQLNDLLYSIAGTIGRVAIVNKDILPANTNQALAIVRPDLSKINLHYLRYALVNPEVKDYLLSKVVHAVQANLSLTEIGNCPIPVPSLVEQKSIAQILFDLDAKIELNRQMNRTLEAMGQALFKRWFSNEDKNSTFGRLSDILEVIESGIRPKGGIDPSLREGVPSIGAENITGIGFYNYSKTKFITPEFYSLMNRGLIKDYDVLVYKDGAYIGRKSMFGKGFPFEKCCVNEHVFILRTNNRGNQFFLYFLLNQEDLKQLNTNSAQPGLNQESMRSLRIIIPTKAKIDRFGDVVKPLIDRIFFNCNQTRILSEIRDSLLPKLMSGKIRTRD